MKEPLEALADVTRLKILGILSEGKPLTNTELYKALKTDGIVYRESIFKALKKLLAPDLVKREFKEKRGYEYSLNFKEIKIGRKLKLKAE
jgi:predicted HTH transcriptional regulator